MGPPDDYDEHDPENNGVDPDAIHDRNEED
jgi:hypothetical protein